MRRALAVAALALLAGQGFPAAASTVENIVSSVPRRQYVPTPTVIVVPKGEGLRLVQLDIERHDVTSVDTDKGGRPLFANPTTLGFGSTGLVVGVDALEVGDWQFYCSIHPEMTGVLKVV